MSFLGAGQWLPNLCCLMISEFGGLYYPISWGYLGIIITHELYNCESHSQPTGTMEWQAVLNTAHVLMLHVTCHGFHHWHHEPLGLMLHLATIL